VLNFLVLLTTYTLTLQATGMPLLGVVATLLLVSLPMFRLWVNYPVLVDRAGFLLLLLIILSDRSGASFLIPLLLCFIASHVKETVPIFAAAVTLNPIYLLPLVTAVLLPRSSGKAASYTSEIPKGFEWLKNPVRSAAAHHRAEMLDAGVLLLPWGLLLLGLLALPTLPMTESIPMILCILVGYGQMIAANDTVRLYQWAAPALLVPAVYVLSSLPVSIALAALMLHVMNPWGARVQV
jgi:hypothetical protein